MTPEDLQLCLHVFTIGEFAHIMAANFGLNQSNVNFVLHDTCLNYHKPSTSSLVTNTHVVQHILQTLIILKSSDCIHLNALLSIVTYFIHSHTQFDVTDLMIYYIERLIVMCDPNYRGKPNPTLGHIITYNLKLKYNITFQCCSRSYSLYVHQ